jgi:hypothetical protein
MVSFFVPHVSSFFYKKATAAQLTYREKHKIFVDISYKFTIRAKLILNTVRVRVGAWKKDEN